MYVRIGCGRATRGRLQGDFHIKDEKVLYCVT